MRWRPSDLRGMCTTKKHAALAARAGLLRPGSINEPSTPPCEVHNRGCAVVGDWCLSAWISAVWRVTNLCAIEPHMVMGGLKLDECVPKCWMEAHGDRRRQATDRPPLGRWRSRKALHGDRWRRATGRSLTTQRWRTGWSALFAWSRRTRMGSLLLGRCSVRPSTFEAGQSEPSVSALRRALAAVRGMRPLIKATPPEDVSFERAQYILRAARLNAGGVGDIDEMKRFSPRRTLKESTLWTSESLTLWTTGIEVEWEEPLDDHDRFAAPTTITLISLLWNPAQAANCTPKSLGPDADGEMQEMEDHPDWRDSKCHIPGCGEGVVQLSEDYDDIEDLIGILAAISSSKSGLDIENLDSGTATPTPQVWLSGMVGRDLLRVPRHDDAIGYIFLCSSQSSDAALSSAIRICAPILQVP
ncbi:hypothetical protein T492DRAFT_843612 [Pavlovales sp. CCMP2436]|nr:hypothetical protein T492DRAFT_843612 [Pavlovales sp. CCMP2436]